MIIIQGTVFIYRTYQLQSYLREWV